MSKLKTVNLFFISHKTWLISPDIYSYYELKTHFILLLRNTLLFVVSENLNPYKENLYTDVLRMGTTGYKSKYVFFFKCFEQLFSRNWRWKYLQLSCLEHFGKKYSSLLSSSIFSPAFSNMSHFPLIACTFLIFFTVNWYNLIAYSAIS